MSLYYIESKRQAQELLALGTDLDARDAFGFTAIDKARDAKVLEFLISSGAEVSGTAVARAVLEDDNEKLRVFLESGASPNTVALGKPLLHFSKSAEIVKTLVLYGANVNAKDELGFNALVPALENCRHSVVKELLKSGAEEPELHFDVNKLVDKNCPSCLKVVLELDMTFRVHYFTFSKNSIDTKRCKELISNRNTETEKLYRNLMNACRLLERCSICLCSDQVGKFISKCCSSAFHEYCALRWLSATNRISCPNCRYSGKDFYLPN